jgi:hypothetical protein
LFRSLPWRRTQTDGAIGSLEWRAAQIREWLLGLLRFAITHHRDDEAMAVSVAGKIDTLGRPPGIPAPSFFRRTTIDVCKAITALDDPNRTAILKMHLARIDDRRLRQAPQAAVDLEEASPRVSSRTKRRALWAGLPG